MGLEPSFSHPWLEMVSTISTSFVGEGGLCQEVCPREGSPGPLCGALHPQFRPPASWAFSSPAFGSRLGALRRLRDHVELPSGLSGESLSGNGLTFFFEKAAHPRGPGWLSPLEPAPVRGAIPGIGAPSGPSPLSPPPSLWPVSSSRKALPAPAAS